MAVLVVENQSLGPKLLRVGLGQGTNRVASLSLMLLNFISSPHTKGGETGSSPLLHYRKKTLAEILRGNN